MIFCFPSLSFPPPALSLALPIPAYICQYRKIYSMERLNSIPRELNEKILKQISWQYGILPTGKLGHRKAFLVKEMPEVRLLVEKDQRPPSTLITNSQWTYNLIHSDALWSLYDDATLQALAECATIFHRLEKPSQETFHRIQYVTYAYLRVNDIYHPTEALQNAINDVLNYWPDHPAEAGRRLCKLWNEFGFLWPQRLKLVLLTTPTVMALTRASVPGDLSQQDQGKIRSLRLVDPSINSQEEHRWVIEMENLGMEYDDDLATHASKNVDIAIGRRRPILHGDSISLRQYHYLCSTATPGSASNPRMSSPAPLPVTLLSCPTIDSSTSIASNMRGSLSSPYIMNSPTNTSVTESVISTKRKALDPVLVKEIRAITNTHEYKWVVEVISPFPSLRAKGKVCVIPDIKLSFTD
ncbi:hypothetical protein BX666DRAFT_1873331 [Dichotomocladium elegans]|nr:hypothetical protein BX666DRAFT_1873331 [Dichotomocladium elegans]